MKTCYVPAPKHSSAANHLFCQYHSWRHRASRAACHIKCTTAPSPLESVQRLMESTPQGRIRCPSFVRGLGVSKCANRRFVESTPKNRFRLTRTEFCTVAFPCETESSRWLSGSKARPRTRMLRGFREHRSLPLSAPTAIYIA